MDERQDELYLLEEKYNGVKSEAFYADCKRLALGEPLAYLIGHIPFLDTTIYLDSRPLIPRPETEYWTKEVIETLTKSTPSLGLDTNQPLHVLDLCAGSGCIGVAIAQAIPEAYVDFSEIEKRHIATIEKNLVENKISKERTNVYHTNLFSNLTQKYDIIISNPPYIDSTLNRVHESVVDFEPHLSLFGGKEGMDVITEIITQAPKHLVRGGQLWLEHEPEQTPAITTLALNNGFTTVTHKDQYNVERYTILVLQ